MLAPWFEPKYILATWGTLSVFGLSYWHAYSTQQSFLFPFLSSLMPPLSFLLSSPNNSVMPLIYASNLSTCYTGGSGGVSVGVPVLVSA